MYGVYTYNSAITFVKNIKEVLEDEYFEAPTDEMKGLVEEIPNELTKFKAKVAITKADVKKMLLEAAALISST